MKRTEKSWLREIEALLGFETDGSLGELFTPDQLAAAEASYRLILG